MEKSMEKTMQIGYVGVGLGIAYRGLAKQDMG